MALFKCQACGAPLEVRDGTEVAFCPYCGMKQTLPKDPVQVMSDGTSVDSLLKRAFMFLEDGEFEKANEYCDRVLDIEPENARAYLCKLMADLRVSKMDNLARVEKLSNNNSYNKILRFGDEGLISELARYNSSFFVGTVKEAVKRNDTKIVNAMLSAGADANARDMEGRITRSWTVLMLAVDGGCTEIVNALLNAGADVNAKSDNGDTALMWAAAWGNTEIVNILLNAGADVNAKNYRDMTALKLAEEEGHTGIVNILKPLTSAQETEQSPVQATVPAQATGCMTMILQVLTVIIIITLLVIYL